MIKLKIKHLSASILLLVIKWIQGANYVVFTN